ncbi:MAG: hypothetical protein K6F59_02405 [Gammaproteobacteria bacterium]|nr:hypothetical protein [Gammaproteobacteria bacterium]
MIKVIDNYFILETSNTSYIFKKDESGILIHLYYGKKIKNDKNTLDNLVNLANHPNGTDVRLSKEYPFGFFINLKRLASSLFIF